MTTVVLTVTVAWLVLAALATVACTLVTRGGLREDRRRARLDAQLARLLADAADERELVVPSPRGTAD